MTIVAGFEQVGRPVDTGRILISADDAEAFRMAAFEGNKVTNEEYSFEEGTSLFQTASYGGSVFNDAPDTLIADSSFYTKNFTDMRANVWQSTIHFARVKRSLDADTELKVYNQYSVESIDGEVARATRQVRVIKRMTEMALSADPLELVDTNVVYSRKAFEVPMKPSDLDVIAAAMQRINSRQRILDPKIV